MSTILRSSAKALAAFGAVCVGLARRHVRRVITSAYANRWRLLGAIAWALLFVRLMWSHDLTRDALITAAVFVGMCLTLGVAYLRHNSASWEVLADDFRTMPPYGEETEDLPAVQRAQRTLDQAWLSLDVKLGLFILATPLLAVLGAEIASVVVERTPLPATPWSARPSAAAAAPAGIAIALSGGGYRAAAMHAGVLDGLRALNVSPTHVTSVSGGSIIGAYYVAGGSPRAFIDAVAQGRFNLRAELADLHNVIRLLDPRFTRTQVQQNLVDRVLLRGLRFADLEPAAPRLMICATDLVTGEGVGFSSDGILYSPVAGSIGSADVRATKAAFVPSDSEGFPGTARVATLVAASGAFPGAFPTVSVKHNGRQLQLADGGIFDNSGTALLMERYRLGRASRDSTWDVGLVISSDAGAPFREDPGRGFLSDLGRVLDIISTNSGAAAAMTGVEGLPVIRLAPDTLLRPASSDSNWLDAMVRHRGASADTIRREVADDLRAFYSAETIEDALGTNAERIYQLGRYLVWSRIDDIQRAVATTVPDPPARMPRQ